MGIRVGSGAERVILCLGFSVKGNSKLRTRSGGRSVRLVRLPGNHGDAVQQSVGPAGPAAWETTGMRPSGRSVRLVQLS
jgi:hypothetical protein